MKIPFFDVTRQYAQCKEEIGSIVAEVLQSGSFIGGKYVRDFEEKMADYLGVKHVLTCGNGTDALELALQSIGVGPGDEVITTPFSFFATSEAIAAVGAIPVFGDIRMSDLNLDPATIEARITEKTKAILPVHIFGAPFACDEVNAIARKHGLRVIEDACQAIGSSYHGHKTGTLSDAGCFSFYPTKNLGAFGDGGMVTTNDDDVATICSALKAHGAGKVGAQAFALLHHETPEDYLPQNATGDALYDPYKYYNFLIGDNSRLDAIQAAILTVKLRYLDQWNQRRHQLAQRYLDALQGTSLRTCCNYEKDSEAVYHQFVILSEHKEALADHLQKNGIGVGAFYPVPLHQQFAHAWHQHPETLPVAEKVCKMSLCLPVFPELTNEEQDAVIDAILTFERG